MARAFSGKRRRATAGLRRSRQDLPPSRKRPTGLLRSRKRQRARRSIRRVHMLHHRRNVSPLRRSRTPIGRDLMPLRQRLPRHLRMTQSHWPWFLRLRNAAGRIPRSLGQKRCMLRRCTPNTSVPQPRKRQRKLGRSLRGKPSSMSNRRTKSQPMKGQFVKKLPSARDTPRRARRRRIAPSSPNWASAP